MAKDTEKLIRQLSLISFLMAERRPVSALEIKQDVEGYSEMNDDAFARRFYADRAELEALGISLKVEKPPEGYFEAELYTLPPENFYLPPIEFSDGELAALQTALALLDGRFAYAEPLRLALQQLSWGRPSPLGAARQRSVAVAVTASAGGASSHSGWPRSRRRSRGARRSSSPTTRSSATRSQAQGRSVPPPLPGRPVLPRRLLARARGHPRIPALADPREDLLRHQGRARLHAARGLRPWRTRTAPTGSSATRREGDGLDLRADRVADRARLRRARRDRAGERSPEAVAGRARAGCRGQASSFTTEYAQARQLVAWVLGLGENARLLEPPELVDEAAERLPAIVERHEESRTSSPSGPPDRAASARLQRSARERPTDTVRR